MDDEQFYARRNLPLFTYVLIVGAEPGKRIGLIKRGESGYYLTDLDQPHRDDRFAHQLVTHLNERLGITAAQAIAMEIGSQFGWNVPGTDATRFIEADARRPR